MASTIKVDEIEGSTGSTVTVPTGQSLVVTDGLGIATGGTGLTSFTAGDILYATGATTLVKLAKGTTEQTLKMNTAASAPEYGTANAIAGGTGQTTWAAGDILYANGSNTLTKLTKPGSTMNLQMTSAGVPSWVAPAAGAWTLIKSQTITSSTADMEWIDGTDDVVLDNTYKLYFLLMTDILMSTDETEIEVRISTDTGSTYKTSGYYSVGAEAYYGSGGSGSQNINQTNNMLMRNHLGNVAAEAAQGQLWIYNPSNATTYPTMGWQFYFALGGGGMARTVNGVGGYRTATAYDAFKIIPDSGTIINMQATLYGIST